jgi:hypothetical protein
MATYYWVGGAGNWDTTNTHWSLTSGGTGGAGVPTSADDVIFDSGSDSGVAFTVTFLAATVSCKNITISAMDFSVTFSTPNLSYLDVYGSWVNPSTNFAISSFGGNTIRFLATTTGNTVTTNGVTLTNTNVVFNSASGGWTLGSALTASNLSLAGGSFNSGNFNITMAGAAEFTTTTAKTVDLGTSVITLGLSGTAWTASATVGTLNASSSTFTLTGTSPTFAGGGKSYGTVNFMASSIGTATISGVNTFVNLYFKGRAAVGISSIIFSGNQTITGTLTASAPTTLGSSRLFFKTNSVTTTYTITAVTVSLTDADFININNTGTAWTGTRLGDCGGNTGITFPAAKTVYLWNTAAGITYSSLTWCPTASATPVRESFPLAQDTINVRSTSNVSNLEINYSYNIGTLDFSVLPGPLALNFLAAPTIYGNVILNPTNTLTGTSTVTFGGRSKTQTINSGTVNWTQPFNINAVSSTIVLASNCVSNAAITLTNGTLNLAGFQMSRTTFTTAAGTKNITFNGGTLALSGTTAFNNAVPAGFTTTAGTGVGTITLTSAAAKTFVGGNSTYNCLLNQGGLGNLTITGANTFYGISNSVSPAIVIFPAAVTTIISSIFGLAGTSGNQITIKSSTAGTKANISKVSGVIELSYCTLQDTNVTGGATWRALTSNGNVDSGNNTGWLWSLVTNVSNFLMFFR